MFSWNAAVSVLSGLVGQILDGKDIAAVAVDAPGAGGVRGFLGAVANLAAPAPRLTSTGSSTEQQTGAAPGRDGEAKPASKKKSWMVDGGMAGKPKIPREILPTAGRSLGGCPWARSPGNRRQTPGKVKTICPVSFNSSVSTFGFIPRLF